MSALHELSDSECLSLLRSRHFGRIGVVSHEGEPLIFPVNYVFDGGIVAIRTDPGTKLTGAALGKVTFEVDEVDTASKTGWSVLVRGTAYDVTDSMDSESEAIRRMAVDVWAPGDKASWIRIEPRLITGRRVAPA